jgi:hypothetical protein
MYAIAAGPSAHTKQNVPHALRRRPDQLALPQEADAHGVDQRVAGITRGKVHLAAERRDPDAVAVVAYPTHHTGKEVAVARVLQGTEAQAVEESDRPGPHGEHVPEDAAHTGRCPLVRLDRGWVVVRLDLKRNCPAVRQPEHASVLARALDYQWT